MNKTQPLISIIIPLYNAEKFISETIQSVIEQTYRNWELFVVDDCSTDNSREIVNTFVVKNDKIKLVESQENFGGPARPRNIGVSHSNGEYLAFLDSDDVWMEDKLELQIAFMQKNRLNFSSTSAINIDEKSNIINTTSPIKKSLRRFKKKGLKQLIQGNFIYLASVILKKDLLIEFNEEEECISVEDYYLWLNLLNKKEVKYDFFEKEILKYRIVDNSISDRSTVGKQEAKAIYFCLKFILKNQRYDLLKHVNKKSIR